MQPTVRVMERKKQGIQKIILAARSSRSDAVETSEPQTEILPQGSTSSSNQSSTTLKNSSNTSTPDANRTTQRQVEPSLMLHKYPVMSAPVKLMNKRCKLVPDALATVHRSMQSSVTGLTSNSTLHEKDHYSPWNIWSMRIDCLYTTRAPHKVLKDQCDYTVIGILGPQGVGKSTILSGFCSHCRHGNMDGVKTFSYSTR